MTMQTSTTSTASQGRDIIAIGGSAGSQDALLTLFRELPASLPAAIFIAYHMPPQAEGLLDRILSAVSTLEVKLADDGEPIRHGVAYVSRPDRHLLVEEGMVRVSHGPRENRWRPAIDSLFRSAAVAYGPRVIGVVLSGMLDDGTAGLVAVKRCGGIAVVQDPRDATYPDMPRSALDNAAVDHSVAIRDLGGLLERLTAGPPGTRHRVPEDIRGEARITAQGVPVSDSAGYVYMCPDCGGPLRKIDEEGLPPTFERYRCMVGHSWSPESLLFNTNETLEGAVWAAIRLFRQRANLLTSQAGRERRAHRERSATHYDEQASEALAHAQRLQEVVLKKDP